MTIYNLPQHFNLSMPLKHVSLRVFDSGPLLSPQITFTHFESANKPQGKRYQNDWTGICDWIEQSTPVAAAKDKLPLIKFATFTNDYRNDANMEAIYGVEGDYDAELMQPHEAAVRLTAANVIAFIYTSPSHTPEKPRWRVIAPISQPRNVSERYNQVGRINGILGGVLANESFTDSQSYYIGRLINGHPVECFRANGGQYIDKIESPIIAPPKANSAAGRKPLGTDRAPDFQLATVALNSLDVNCDRAEWRDISFAFRHAVTGLVSDDMARLWWDAWNTGFSKSNEPGANDKQWRSADNGTNFGWSYLQFKAIKSGNLTDDQRARMTLGNPTPLLMPHEQQQSQAPRELDGYENVISTATGDNSKNTLIETVKLLHGNLPVALDEFTKTVLAMTQLPWDKNSSYPRQWTETDTIHCQLYVQASFIRPGKETVHDAITIIANRHRKHQVRDYLNALQWDGIERLPLLATQYFGTEDTPYTRAVGVKFMVGATARIMKAGCKMDNVVVLEGAQGKLKSSSIAALAGSEWFTDELPDLQTKDAAIQLTGKWIIEVSELSALKRSDVETIKKFMSRSTDRYRAPYERIAIDHPRQSIFVATTNDEQYLKDQTGNRRFWPLACGTIDIEAIRRDRDQLWAETVARYRNGERWWFDASEDNLARAEQEERREVDPWQEKITSYVEALNGLPTTTETICFLLSIPFERQNSIVNKRIATCLNHAGYFRKQIRYGEKRDWRYVKTTSAH